MEKIVPQIYLPTVKNERVFQRYIRTRTNRPSTLPFPIDPLTDLPESLSIEGAR